MKIYNVSQYVSKIGFETILTEKLIEITNIYKEWQTTHWIKHEILKDWKHILL